MMEIHIPEDIGGGLRNLPEGTYGGTIQDLFIGTSKAGEPKLTVKWLITTEFTGKQEKGYVSTVGENVLENFSLQPQALWNLNTLYRDVKGIDLAKGDYDAESLEAFLKEALLGVEANLLIEDDTGSGEVRSKITQRVII
jgi:hypothetical protein